MKKIIFILTIILIIFMYDTFIFKNTTYDLYNLITSNDNYEIINNKSLLKTSNEKENYYVYKEVKSDHVKIYNELINKLYTIINKGYDKYTIYCDYDCTKDIINLQDDENAKHINDFVNTYNKFKNIRTLNYDNGKVDLIITKLYSEDEINSLNNIIDNIINNYGINNYDTYTKIKIFHDYLVNNTRYDQSFTKESSDTNPIKATGPLLYNSGVCAGYTDAFSLFLDKINVENFKISTTEHTWNVVNIDNNYLHIDATFDDPITDTGEDILIYDYYLKTTSEIEEKNDKDHIINYQIYDFIK